MTSWKDDMSKCDETCLLEEHPSSRSLFRQRIAHERFEGSVQRHESTGNDAFLTQQLVAQNNLGSRAPLAA